MIGANEEFKIIMFYCKAILNAESEEEISQIKQGLLDDLRESGKEEQIINYFDTYLDQMVGRFESGELAFDENGMLVINEEFMQESLNTPAPDSTELGGMSNTSAGVALGLVASAIVVSIKVKKMFDKNKKIKRL